MPSSGVGVQMYFLRNYYLNNFYKYSSAMNLIFVDFYRLCVLCIFEHSLLYFYMFIQILCTHTYVCLCRYVYSMIYLYI